MTRFTAKTIVVLSVFIIPHSIIFKWQDFLFRWLYAPRFFMP